MRERERVDNKNDNIPFIRTNETVNIVNKMNVKNIKPIVKTPVMKATQIKEECRCKCENQKQKHSSKHYSDSPMRGNQRNWNQMMAQKHGSNFQKPKRACFVCGKTNHIAIFCIHNPINKQHKNKNVVQTKREKGRRMSSGNSYPSHWDEYDFVKKGNRMSNGNSYYTNQDGNGYNNGCWVMYSLEHLRCIIIIKCVFVNSTLMINNIVV